MCIGVGAALVTEEFAIHRTLRDGAAVDGKVRTVLAGRTIVDDAREMLFSHTRLTRDEYAQIRRGYLDGNLDGAIQLRVGADDLVSLFDGLYICFCHDSIHFGLQNYDFFFILASFWQKNVFYLHMSEKSCTFAR